MLLLVHEDAVPSTWADRRPLPLLPPAYHAATSKASPAFSELPYLLPVRMNDYLGSQPGHCLLMRFMVCAPSTTTTDDAPQSSAI